MIEALRIMAMPHSEHKYLLLFVLRARVGLASSFTVLLRAYDPHLSPRTPDPFTLRINSELGALWALIEAWRMTVYHTI